MYYKKLVGNNVYLSPIDIENETPIMTKWLNEDQDIAYFNGFYGSLLGEEKISEKMNKWNEGPFMFSIVSLKDDSFMGHISLFNIDTHALHATMGIYLGSEYRKKGLGKEAMQLLIDYAFNTQRYNAIHIEVFGFNENAYHVYQKFGFKECGRWHNSLYHQGKYHDIILMELLKENYKN